MERKNNTGLMVVIVIFALLLGGFSGFIINDKILNNNTSSNNNEQKEEENIVNDEINDNKEEITENNYELYANNLKNKMSEEFNDNNYLTKYVEVGCVDGGYSVWLDSNKLYIEYYESELNQKFGKKKIADNVLNYYVINTGQNVCNMIYYINEDGTVSSANIESSVQAGNDIEIKNNIGNYKNIISVTDAVFGDGNVSVRGPIFIDINGNIYSDNLQQ